jgi:hypothetical protein
MSEYFAVVKDGEAAIVANKRAGPISQTIDPVQCHLQTSGTQDGFAYRVYATTGIRVAPIILSWATSILVGPGTFLEFGSLKEGCRQG